MKTPMPPGVYWCPFCETKPYKSKANLSNHIEEKHEPQKQYHCRDCSRSWNLPLGRSRHLGRSNCSAQHFDSTHHTNKKTLYACGVCIAVFDDFGLREDHLATHQQGGTGKAAWSKDNLMRGVLSHSSISGSWYAPRHPQTNLFSLSWDWNDQKVIGALESLEYKRFINDHELHDILDIVASTSKNADIQQDLR